MSTSRTPWAVVKGIATTYTVQVVDGNGNPILNQFAGTEPMTAYAWPGDDQAQSFSLSPSWNSGPLGLVDVQVPAANTAAQAAGIYQWLLKLADGTAALAVGELELKGAAGAGLPGLPDLATLPYVQSALAAISLTPEQVDYLPYAVNAASNMVRRFCSRRFTRATLTEYSAPSLEGVVRLNAIPVNRVLRVSNKLLTVVTITADPTLFQNAYVNFATTGDEGYSNTPLTYTALVLNSVASGVATMTPLAFASYATLGALATAVNAVAGWTATVSPGYAPWATSELFGDDGAQGALDQGVALRVFTEDVSKMRVDLRTGMLSLGYNAATSGFGPKWGPTWFAMDDPTGWGFDDNFVRVIYDAGYDVVPPQIQMATAELAKAIVERFRTDFMLKGESIGAYKYELRDFYHGIPEYVREVLAYFKITNA